VLNGTRRCLPPDLDFRLLDLIQLTNRPDFQEIVQTLLVWQTMDKLSQKVATRPAKKKKSCTVRFTPDDVALPHNLQLTSSRRFKLDVLHFVIQKIKHVI
jgi:hypothetical protein